MEEGGNAAATVAFCEEGDFTLYMLVDGRGGGDDVLLGEAIVGVAAAAVGAAAAACFRGDAELPDRFDSRLAISSWNDNVLAGGGLDDDDDDIDEDEDEDDEEPFLSFLPAWISANKLPRLDDDDDDAPDEVRLLLRAGGPEVGGGGPGGGGGGTPSGGGEL